MVKFLMHGCNGKMGRMITEIVKNDENAVIAAGVDAYTGVPNEYPVFESIDKCDVDVDVVIDFSTASAVDGLLDYCVQKKLPVVLCTTGLSEDQLKKVEEAAKETAVLKSANMSLGINLLLKLLKDAAKVLAPAGFDMEIAHAFVGSLTEEIASLEVWQRAAYRHGGRQGGHAAYLVVDMFGYVYRDVAAVALGPPFLPEVSGHFGHLLNFGGKGGTGVEH